MQDYKVISGCPRCKGAIVPYRSFGRGIHFTKELAQCFQCGRIYRWEGRWADYRVFLESDPNNGRRKIQCHSISTEQKPKTVKK